jgi:pyruvate/2-oxoglutarate dehydrogenase complex dihydrolipoamide dehydrogenase (E3) component
MIVAERLKPDLCIIGAGAAGLSVAAAAAAFGVAAVLIEKGRMGGECLNTGCVPSKAMIAAGKRAEAFRDSARFGVPMPPPGVEFDKVNDHIHRVINAIAPNDSRERFTGLGVRVIQGAARFRDPRTIVIGPEHDISHEIEARRFVIATGSLPVVPPIPGIEQVPYFTNENIFETREQPRHLIILGAGPNGLELAQAFRRLGSEVTVLEREQPVQREDPECAAVVLDALAREGVTVRSGVKVERLRRLRQTIEVVLDGEEIIQGTDLLIAAGRRPNFEGLDLDAAGVQHQPDGILLDKRFRTSNKRVYAIGDVTGLPQFTHAANHEASLLIRHLLFRLPIAMNLNEIPRVTFTDPELAHVGLTVDQARERHGSIRVLRWSYRDNDRAQAEGKIRGHIKVVTDRKGAILGTTIVGAAAAEQITSWTLAIANRLNIRALAEIVMPYPTYSEVGKRAAISFFTPRLTTSWVRRLLKLMRCLG